MNGTKTRIRMSGGEADAYVTHPNGAGPWPGVLFYMDALGWRASMFEMADRLASNGYCVLLPNVFWRSGPPEVFDAKTAFGDPALREKIMKLIGSLPNELEMKDTATYLDFLAALPQVKDKQRFATTGYCMGGGFSLCAAATFPDRIAASASFHGGGFVTAPDSPELIAQKVRARVYIGAAEVDRSHTAETSKALDAALTQAKVPHQVELYAGASHGFAVPDHSVYNRDAAERHWDRLVNLLRETWA
jgi:carboxymethylenebutenolidase